MIPSRLPTSVARAKRRRDPRGPRWSAIALTLAVALMIAAMPKARAATATANLLVTATVSATCTITTSPLAFGAYDPVVTHASTALDATGSVTIACTKGSTGLSVGIGNGNDYSGGTRRMSGSGDFLSYVIYRPPNNTPGTACTFPGTLAWGTTIGTNTLALTNATSKAPRTYNVCGTIPAGQDVTVATYSDTVVATINF
ncbi:MAG TPA: spore coat U domain-containing protein [Casimicrobiaceae bacterium]